MRGLFFKRHWFLTWHRFFRLTAECDSYFVRITSSPCLSFLFPQSPESSSVLSLSFGDSFTHCAACVSISRGTSYMPSQKQMKAVVVMIPLLSRIHPDVVKGEPEKNEARVVPDTAAINKGSCASTMPS